MKRNLNLLFAIINAYKGKEDLAHFSTCELNKKFGISKNDIPKMLRISRSKLCRESYY